MRQRVERSTPELPKFTHAAAELTMPLERWLYFLKHGEELDTAQLPVALQQPMIERALGELQMMSQSRLERERYEARLKGQRDYATALAEARREGQAEGRAEGQREGLIIGQLHLCQQLLGQPLTPVESLRGLPLAELEQQVERLKAELTGPSAGRG
jgi:predicted transposase/invertase (TIGR01784 family)